MGIINQQLFPDFFIGDHSPVRLMGVINLSPESFFKPSFYSGSQLLEVISQFITNSVSIIDLGARSTAPGVVSISVQEEQNRMLEALEIIKDHIPHHIILSIDTQYSEIAQMCIHFCREHNLKIIINDVSSLKTDPSMIDVIISNQCPLIIMASNQKPGDVKTISEILTSLSNSINLLKQRGYDMTKLIIDPGVGKWIPEKTFEYDLEILDYLSDFRCFGYPILVGLSRKSFIGSILEEKDPLKRDIGSLAATSIAVYNGAHIIRTHDPNLSMVQTIKIASAIRKRPIIIHENNQICEYIGNFKSTESAYFFLRQYGITPAGSRIMKGKMITKIILIRNITAPQGLILKQEMLARGGDVGLHSQVITTEWQKNDEKFDVIIIGTMKQYQELIGKLRGQQLKLDLIGTLIETTLEQEKNSQKNYIM